MLGTPPAFILSQDQTLRLKRAASLPHPFDLGFRRLPRPFGGLGSPGGHLSIRFISQYPVFKVLASPSGGPRRLPSGRAAQGDTLPSRCHPVKNFFSKTFGPSPSGRPRAASSSKTQPEYNTLPAAAWQGVFRENLRDGGAGRAFAQAGGGKEDPAASPSREAAGARAGRKGGSGGRRGARGKPMRRHRAFGALPRRRAEAQQDPEGGGVPYSASKNAATASIWPSGVEAPAVTPTAPQPASQAGSISSGDSMWWVRGQAAAQEGFGLR